MADSGSMIAININTLTYTHTSSFSAVGIADLGSSQPKNQSFTLYICVFISNSPEGSIFEHQVFGTKCLSGVAG